MKSAQAMAACQDQFTGMLAIDIADAFPSKLLWRAACGGEVKDLRKREHQLRREEGSGQVPAQIKARQGGRMPAARDYGIATGAVVAGPGRRPTLYLPGDPALPCFPKCILHLPPVRHNMGSCHQYSR